MDEELLASQEGLAPWGCSFSHCVGWLVS